MGCLAFYGSRSTDQINFNVDHDQFKNVFPNKHGTGFTDPGNSFQFHAQHGQNFIPGSWPSSCQHLYLVFFINLDCSRQSQMCCGYSLSWLRGHCLHLFTPSSVLLLLTHLCKQNCISRDTSSFCEKKCGNATKRLKYMQLRRTYSQQLQVQ